MKKICISLLLFSSIYSYSQCFTKIASSALHLTALKNNGTLWGWGSNGNYQLSSNYIYPFVEQTPIQLSPDTDWQIIENGRDNTFAIKTNGKLWATGINLNSCLGLGSTATNILNLTQVGTASWKAIASGYGHSAGIQSDGTLWGWGRNDYNQVGNNTCCNDVMVPVQISADTDWSKIDASILGYTLAIKNNGTLWGWGKNESAFGDSGTTSLPIPTQLSSDTDWAEMSTYFGHILLLKTNGTLWVFGGGSNGAMGLGSPTTYTFVPLQLGTDTWKSIGTGIRTSFAVKSDGTLWTWGLNDEGQLGLGGTTDRYVPTQIGTDNNWAKVICGADHTIAIKNDGTAYAWGINYFASTTNGTFIPMDGTYTPVLLPTAMNGVCAVLENESFTTPNNTIILTPNPVNESTTLTFINTPETSTVTVYNLLGATMDSFETTNQTAYTINTSKYSAGMYVVVVATANGQTQQYKLIKD